MNLMQQTKHKNGQAQKICEVQIVKGPHISFDRVYFHFWVGIGKFSMKSILKLISKKNLALKIT